MMRTKANQARGANPGGKPVLGICAILLGLVSSSAVATAPPRDRSLTYDSASKSWVELPAPEPGTPEGDLRQINLDIKAGHTGRALRRVKKFEKDHGSDHPLYPKVLLARARARIERREYDKAHTELQSFLDQFAGLAETTDALRLEFVIAEAYLSGAKRKLFGLRLLSGEDVAFRILDEISTGYPELEIAPLAIKTKADYLFARGDHDLAEIEFARLLRDHPAHRYHQYALRQSARSALASFRGTQYDEAALVESEERFREYGLRYPDDAKHEAVARTIDGIQSARAAKDLDIGRYYERTDHIGSAIYYYRLVAKDWPGTFAAERAHDRLVLLGVLEDAEPIANVAPASGEVGG